MGDDDREVGKGKIMMTLFTNLRNLNFTLKALGLPVKDLKHSSDIIRSITATMDRQLTDPQMSHLFFTVYILFSLLRVPRVPAEILPHLCILCIHHIFYYTCFTCMFLPLDYKHWT